MIRHFFLDKTNTIIQDSQSNLGLNPILGIGYGNRILRGLLHFNADEIKSLIDDKTFANKNKLKFTLKMTNCFSVDGLPYEKSIFNDTLQNGKRASSFDLILFKLPCEFDAGRGFEFSSDFYIKNKKSINENGSNWYFSKTMIPWEYEKNKIDLEDKTLNLIEIELLRKKYNDNSITINGGIFPLDYISNEYEKYINGEDSIIVGVQHFDFGNENLSIDITDYVLECINTGVNNGLCLAFSPYYESFELENIEYVGFFTDHTNTFFHPYIEADYCEYIMDDRENFTIGKDNRLYLYVFDDGVPANLDNNPICSVNDLTVSACQSTKGVYYAVLPASAYNFDTMSVYYDKWSEIVLNGVKNEDIELEFATDEKSKTTYFGSVSVMNKMLVPSISGINDDEKLSRNEVREVIVDLRKKFTTDKKELSSKCFYRLYVKDGERELDVINYHPVEKSFLNNYFLIHTMDLIPNEYYVDIIVMNGREKLYFKRVLKFSVVSNVTERYE